MALDKITTAIIADDAVTAAKIVAGAVGTSEIADGTVVAADIGADAIGTAEIANDVTISTSGNIATTGSGTLTVAGTSTLTGNATASGNLTVTGDIVPSTPLSHRNMIINGAMNVAQRGTSFADLSSATQVIDRYKIRTSGASGTFDVTQDSDSPVGFNNSLKITNDATETIDGTSDYLGISYKIEAQDCQQLGYGSATAKASTLSFWVRSTVTGTGVIYIQIEDDSYKQWSGSYTISTTNTWEYKTLTIPANTASTINDDNGLGLDINWFIFAGSAYSSGGSLSSSWEASATNKQGYGQTNFMGGATGRIFQMTGVQFEVGSNATPFEHRSYGDELARCQRYFTKNGYQLFAHTTSGSAITNWCPAVPMRVVPAVAIKGQGTYSSTTAYYEDVPWAAVGTLTSAAITVGNSTEYGGAMRVYGTFSDSPTAGKPVGIFLGDTSLYDGNPTNYSWFELSAEL